MEIKITNKDSSITRFEANCELTPQDAIVVMARLEKYIDELKEVMIRMGTPKEFIEKNVNRVKLKMIQDDEGKDIGIYGVKI